MDAKLTTLLRRSGLVILGLLCCAALPAAVLRYAVEMPAKFEPGDQWLPWLLTGYVAADLIALGLLLRFRRHWAVWAFAAACGLAPFISIYFLAK